MSDDEKCKNTNTKPSPEPSPDPLTSTIMTMHYVFISCVGYVILYTSIKYLGYILGLAGFNIYFEYPLISDAIYWFLWLLLIAAGIISVLLFVILFWIFIHWLLIITFVPFIIIFPIPIFPFIFILPLQPLMLELIPPFKVLTNTGTLPYMLSISKRLFSDEFIKNTYRHFILPSTIDTKRYFYTNVRQMVSDMFYYDIQSIYDIPPEKCKKSKNDIIKSIRTDDNIEDEKKYNEYKEISSVKKSMKKIGEDTELCTSMHQKFKEYNSSYLGDILTDVENSFTPYNSCYSGAIKSYLKTSITQ